VTDGSDAGTNIKKGIEDVKKSAGSNKWFLVLIGIFMAGLGGSIYFTVTSEYVPVNKKVIPFDNNDIKVVLTIEDNMQIPVRTFFEHKKSDIGAEVYPKLPIVIDSVRLYPNASSILTKMDKVTDLKKDEDGIFRATIETGHQLEIKNLNEKYILNVLYRNDSSINSASSNGTANSPIYIADFPFIWNLSTLDFGKPSYFWIVFLGVLISRVFTFTSGSDKVGASLNFSNLELLWVPFSAIITLLIFSSFREQVQLTTDVMTNVALAFGFGFGFDKVFEVWAKTPGKRKKEE
jgi:hypothetical protein